MRIALALVLDAALICLFAARLGFTEVGTLDEVGFKFGSYVTTGHESMFPPPDRGHG